MQAYNLQPWANQNINHQMGTRLLHYKRFPCYNLNHRDLPLDHFPVTATVFEHMQKETVLCIQ